jgi:HlyD family secretion protein
MSAIRRHPVAISVTLLVLLVGALAGPRVVGGPEVVVDVVLQQDFVQTLVANGRVETPHRVQVGVQVPQTVRRVPVSEGDVVAAGATLIELDATELRAALDQATRTVQAAAAQLRQLREVQSPQAAQAVQQAELAQESATASRQRSESLFAAGAISRVALEDAQRAEAMATAQLRSAQQQAAGAMPTGSAAAAAAAALAQAQAGADMARARFAYATVTAPTAGTVIARDVEPGDIAQPARTLLVISPEGETQLEVAIDEKHLPLLKRGLGALASADAWPDKRFTAELVYISPGVDAQRGSVIVRLHVPNPPAYLKQDMTVSVDIAVARRDDALLVPTDAVHDLETDSPWVLMVDGRRARRQAVTLGLRSDGLCEVLGGLSAGDRVVPVVTTAVTDGSRLRSTLAP